MTDLAHTDLGHHLDQARNAYYRAMHNGELDAADLALRQLDRLLDEYIALPKQDDRLRGHPTDRP